MESVSIADHVREPPTLPSGVPECEGFPRPTWYSKRVTLKNENGVDVGIGLCQSVDSDFVPETAGSPLGDDHVAILIVESLVEDDIPLDWMYALRAWPVTQVVLNDVSLYNHEQRSIYNAALKDYQRGPRSGVRQYESSRQINMLRTPSKRVVLLSSEAINSVSSRLCCTRNCLQPFPRAAISALCSTLHCDGSSYFRRHILLDVHRQIHLDATRNRVVTLDGNDVCPEAWRVIMGVGRSTFYRHQNAARDGARAEHHGNAGRKKPRTHTMQAIATLRDMLDNVADHMPHKTTTLDTGEKVVSKILPSSFRWSALLPEVNKVNDIFGLRAVFSSGLSRIRGSEFREYTTKKRGDSFARCGTCDQFKQIKSASTRGSAAYNLWETKLKQHQGSQQAHRILYYGNRKNSEDNPDEVLCIIHDKMDHSKTASPHFSHKNKATDSFMKLPISVIGMIAHGHGDVRYAHYSLDIFPTDSNHTIGSLAKLLRDLEQPPKYSSRELFAGSRCAPLFEAILANADVCLGSLPPPPIDPVPAKQLPPVLQMQLDNATGDNKNRYVFAFFSLLVHKGVFREVYINFLLVGHTHEDIDALFGRWSSQLKSNSYPTIPLLMKSFMDAEMKPVIPHLIEELPNFKDFLQGYLCDRNEALEGHTNAQQFKFYKDSNGWPMMQYKLLCTDREWLPKENGGIRLWKEASDGTPMTPLGEPTPLSPRCLRNFDEIKKGLSGFVSLWNSMANEDLSGEFRRKNEHIMYYWRAVMAALDVPLVALSSLQERFWPESRYAPSLMDQFENDGTLREEYGEDVPFVGQRCHRPPPSFRVGIDVHAGLVIALRSTEADLRPLWIALALTEPHPDPEHSRQIQIQYFMPTSTRHVNPDTYSGWDSKQGNCWIHDIQFDPMWLDTHCIITAWKPRARVKAICSRLKI